MNLQTGAHHEWSNARKAVAAAALVAVTLALRAPLLPAPGFPGDQGQFFLWAMKSRANGMGSIYEPQPESPRPYLCNYPPAYPLVLRALAIPLSRVTPTIEEQTGVFVDIMEGNDTPAAGRAATILKLPAVIADAVLALMLFLWLTPRIGLRPALLAAVVYLAIPAIIHNSAVWCQMDSIAALLMIASMEAARRQRMVLMGSLAILACLTKAQSVLLLPVWIAALAVWLRPSPRRIINVAAAMILTALPILAPFSKNPGGVVCAYRGAADYYPFLHLNGFSAWFLANPLIAPQLDGRLAVSYLRDDMPWLLGISPRSIGIILLLCVWIWVVVRIFHRRADEYSLTWAARLLPLAFFVLSTGMHERYIYPAIGLWAWSGLRGWKDWMAWIALSTAATVNILWSWPGPDEAWWADAALRALRTTWLGMAPGVWCSLILSGILVWTLVWRPRRITSAAT